MNRILKRIAIGNDLKKIIDTYGKGTVDSAILNELEQYTYSRDLLEESFPFNTGDYEENGDTYQELQDYTAQEALTASIELARLADRRGYNRYWIAEHHSMPSVTTSSPAMLLARLVGETSNIRLGSGGMMLPNFPPLVVAEQFGLLASMPIKEDKLSTAGSFKICCANVSA